MTYQPGATPRDTNNYFCTLKGCDKFGALIVAPLQGAKENVLNTQGVALG
jgi:hypothetical protein